MAIAFARVSLHSRSQGHSAVAGAAYRSGQKLYDERTGETHDFQNRGDVVYDGILLPEDTDEKYLDRELLWNSAESCEKRKDSQVAKDIILALPRELSLSHHIELTHQFSHQHFVKNGIPVDVAIHDHGDGNPHAHLYVTTRRLGPQGFDRYKARDLNPSFANSQTGRGFVSEDEAWGQRWRECQTAYFQEHNLDVDVDENHIIPQRHQGRIRGQESHYLEEDNLLRREASIHIALAEPETILALLSKKHSVFTEHDIARLIHKNTESIEQFQFAMAKVKVARDLIELGVNERGQPCYTTRAIFNKETQMTQHTDKLIKQHTHIVPMHLAKSAIKRYSLNEGQAECLKHLTDNTGLSIIMGRAGTGKSYMLNAARDVWEKAGYSLTGMAISGIAAQGLQESSGINSKTIAYYRKLIQHDKWPLSSKDIVVIDEAGMCDLNTLAAITQHVKQAKAKLVLVGDTEQLQPIGPGAPLRALVERAGFAELNHIMRQKNAGDRQASTWLSQGKVDKAIAHYHQQQQIHFSHNGEQAYQDLVTAWKQSLNKSTLPQQMILAHRNQDVGALNLVARQALINADQLSQQAVTHPTSKGELALAQGERLLFLRNDKELGVCNGHLGTITKVSKETVTVQLDNKKNRSITFSPRDYPDFTYGYAQTIHKAQGATYDNVFVYVAGHYWDRHLSYVALSRHKERVSLYTHKEAFRNREELSQAMSQERIKDNALDWPLSFAIRRGFNPDTLIGKIIETIGKAKEAIMDKWQWLRNNNSEIKPNDPKTHILDNPAVDWSKLNQLDHPHTKLLCQYKELIQNKTDTNTQRRIYQQAKNLHQKISANHKLQGVINEILPSYTLQIHPKQKGCAKDIDVP